MHKYPLRASRALLALSVLIPLVASAAGSISVTDTVAGIGTEAVINGFAANTNLVLSVDSPAGREATVQVTTDSTGGARTRIPGSSTRTAGTYNATIGDGGGKTQFRVFPDRVDAAQSAISVDRRSIEPDGKQEATIEVTLSDQFGNPLPGRPVKLVSSRSTDTITQLTRETDGKGTQTFALRTREPGAITVRAIDLLSDTDIEAEGHLTAGTMDAAGGPETDRNDQTSPNHYAAQIVKQARAQDFDVLQSFEVNVDPKELNVGEVGNIQIRAVDRSGRTVEDYTGTVKIFSPTDAEANLPGFSNKDSEGSVTFTAKNLGEKFIPLSLSFKRSGEQTLRVEDRANPKQVISGETTVQVTGRDIIDPKYRIQILKPRQDGAVNTLMITVEGVGPPYADLEILGGKEDVKTETGKDGTFQAPVELPANQKEFTLRVRDVSGRYDSGNIHFFLDNDPPKIASITFTPVKPEEGANVLLVVETEKQSTVTMKLGEEAFTMKEDANKPGSYQTLFTAPDAGEAQPAIIATDEAGNRTEVRATLTVVPKALPKVRNLKAVAKANAVELAWDDVTGPEPIEHYRLYIAENDPKDVHTIDTKDATPAASVAGLKAGETYYIAVTAVLGDRESGEKSNVVTMKPLGLKLRVMAQDGALQLTWAFPDGPPLSSYVLRYGTAKDMYTEERILNGQLQTFTIRDLINGVTYFVQMTPVTTTGDVLADIAAAGEGTPTGLAGFHPSASEEAPFDPNAIAPPDQFHEGAPNTPGSGLPSFAWWMAGAVAAVIGIFQWQARRSKRKMRELFSILEQRYK